MNEILSDFARTAAAVIAQHLQDAQPDASPHDGDDGCSCPPFEATIGLELQEEGQTTTATITVSNEPDRCGESGSHHSLCGCRNVGNTD